LAPAIFFLTSGMVFGANWQQINSGLPITVAGVKALIVDPKTPSTLYASTANGSVFKTTDGGGSWTPLSTVTAVNLLIGDPKNPSTLYAATGYGVLKSLDGGESWAGANTGLPGSGIYTLVADPSTPSTLYAPSAGTLFKSTDGAQTWSPVATKFYASAEATIPLAVDVLWDSNALVIDPKNSSTMYAQAWANPVSGLFKSTDGGNTWYPLAGVPASVQTIPVFDPVNPSTIYLGYNASLLKSTDDGATWTTIGQGVPANSNLQTLAIDPATPSVVYATYLGAGGWGLIKSTDGGQTFNPLDTGLPPYDTSSVVAISPTSPPTVYAGYADLTIRRGRLVKSGDGGATWNAADAGLTFIDILSVAIDPANTSTIYAGMGGGGEGLFRSVDSGATWSNLAQFQITGIPAFSLSFSPQGEPALVDSLLIGFANPNILYAATMRLSRACIYTDKLFFKSTDGGVSWNNIANPPQGGCGFFFSYPLLELNPTNADQLFLGGQDDCGDAFLDQSPDAGMDWSVPNYGFASGLNALVIDPSNPATLYAGAPEGVFKSTNGGVAWTYIGLSVGVSALAIDRANPSIIYAATGGSYPNPAFQGMFKSIDGGASWAPINTGLAGVISTGSPVTALAMAPGNANILYAATSGNGAYKSTDGGASWTAFNDGLTNLDVSLLTVAPKAPNTLYAATPAGTFRLIDETPVSKPRR
jgi:photosystem II stability/assembly factor-like uncharacterized protein